MPFADDSTAFPSAEMERIRRLLEPATTGATCGAVKAVDPERDRLAGLTDRIEALEREMGQATECNRSELLSLLARNPEARAIREGMDQCRA
jgi:hypothetical protein